MEKETINETVFLRTENSFHCFMFRCEPCESVGELQIPIEFEFKRFDCPTDCGAVYVLWIDPLTIQPALRCVICPFFSDEDEDYEETCYDCGEWERCTCFDD